MAGLSYTCQAYAKHTSGVSSSATAADTSVDNYGITHQTGKNRHFKQWSGTIGYIYIYMGNHKSKYTTYLTQSLST